MYKLAESITGNSDFIAYACYAIALAWLLLSGCPFLFAIWIAFPVALMIGIPFVLAVGSYLLLADVFSTVKDFKA